MGPLQAFHHHPIMNGVWIATCALWILPELALSKRLHSTKDAKKADRGSMAVVILSVYLGISLGFLAANRVPSLSMGAYWKIVFALGITVWWSGIALRLYSIRVLGRFFTFDVAIAEGHSVVEEGPYRWVRHPSYTGGLLAMLGLGMTLDNWLAMFLPVCCLAAGDVYRIPVEEKALVRGLGAEYRDYMRRTWRLIPFVF
jgi:protein-S-isoprenylcysteine O-methyltransferase Ste14